MTDADGRIIPWVEGDQGEGIKDFLDEFVEAGLKTQTAMDKIIQNFNKLADKEGDKDGPDETAV